MKRKDRVGSFFRKHDFKVGTTFRNKDGTKTRTIVSSHLCGIDVSDTGYSFISFFVRDQNGFLYNCTELVDRTGKPEFKDTRNIDLLALNRELQLTKILSKETLHIYF